MKKMLYFLALLSIYSFAARPNEHPMPDQTHNIKLLEPVTYGNPGHEQDNFGLNVESTRDVYPQFVTANGLINSTPFIWALIEVVQKLIKRVEDLENGHG